MNTTFSDTFHRLIGPKGKFSKKVFGGFLWSIVCDREKDDTISAYLMCSPVESIVEWSCTTEFSLCETHTRTTKNERYTDSSDHKEMENTCGFSNFFKCKDGLNFFTIVAVISIKDYFIGKKLAVPLQPSPLKIPVTFFRRLPLTSLLTGVSLYTSHEAQGKLWVVTVNTYYRESLPGSVRFKLKCYDIETGSQANPNVTVVILLEGDPVLVKSGTLRDTIKFTVNIECDLVVTFSIIDPNPTKEGSIQGVDFGTNYLSAVSHDNMNLLSAAE